MRVEPKALIRRLTPTGTRALEAAVGRAVSGGYHEISVEHLLASLLAPDEGDVARIFHNWNVDRARFLARVDRAIQAQKSGGGGRPVISQSVFGWIEDAWLMASVELGATVL